MSLSLDLKAEGVPSLDFSVFWRATLSFCSRFFKASFGAKALSRFGAEALSRFGSSADAFAISWLESRPEKLQEIKIFGAYYAGDPKEIEDSERYYRKTHTLKEGQKLADHPPLAHMLEYLGKERFKFNRKKPMIYCYEKASDEDRESAPVFNPDLRARMYDREGELLAEDILRDDYPGRDPFAKYIVAYLPYRNNGDVTIRIVRLEREKEILLYEWPGLHSHETLKRQDLIGPHEYGYAYKFYRPDEWIKAKTPCYR